MAPSDVGRLRQGGQWPLLFIYFFYKNIIIYIDTNFRNFILENYT